MTWFCPKCGKEQDDRSLHLYSVWPGRIDEETAKHPGLPITVCPKARAAGENGRPIRSVLPSPGGIR